MLIAMGRLSIQLKKVKRPSHSPAMVRDRPGIIDDLKAMRTEGLKKAEERLPGQTVKDDEPISF